MLESQLPAIVLGDAPIAARLNLAVQILMGLVLLVGMVLARKKRFRAHGICQSIVVLINLIPILYYCTIHGEPGGKDMAGTIVVTK